MSAWWLTLIIPAAFLLGFACAALLGAAKNRN